MQHVAPLVPAESPTGVTGADDSSSEHSTSFAAFRNPPPIDHDTSGDIGIGDLGVGDIGPIGQIPSPTAGSDRAGSGAAARNEERASVAAITQGKGRGPVARGVGSQSPSAMHQHDVYGGSLRRQPSETAVAANDSGLGAGTPGTSPGHGFAHPPSGSFAFGTSGMQRNSASLMFEPRQLPGAPGGALAPQSQGAYRAGAGPGVSRLLGNSFSHSDATPPVRALQGASFVAGAPPLTLHNMIPGDSSGLSTDPTAGGAATAGHAAAPAGSTVPRPTIDGGGFFDLGAVTPGHRATDAPDAPPVMGCQPPLAPAPRSLHAGCGAPITVPVGRALEAANCSASSPFAAQLLGQGGPQLQVAPTQGTGGQRLQPGVATPPCAGGSLTGLPAGGGAADQLLQMQALQRQQLQRQQLMQLSAATGVPFETLEQQTAIAAAAAAATAAAVGPFHAQGITSPPFATPLGTPMPPPVASTYSALGAPAVGFGGPVQRPFPGAPFPNLHTQTDASAMPTAMLAAGLLSAGAATHLDPTAVAFAADPAAVAAAMGGFAAQQQQQQRFHMQQAGGGNTPGQRGQFSPNAPGPATGVTAGGYQRSMRAFDGEGRRGNATAGAAGASGSPRPDGAVGGASAAGGAAGGGVGEGEGKSAFALSSLGKALAAAGLTETDLEPLPDVAAEMELAARLRGVEAFCKMCHWQCDHDDSGFAMVTASPATVAGAADTSDAEVVAAAAAASFPARRCNCGQPIHLRCLVCDRVGREARQWGQHVAGKKHREQRLVRIAELRAKHRPTAPSAEANEPVANQPAATQPAAAHRGAPQAGGLPPRPVGTSPPPASLLPGTRVATSVDASPAATGLASSVGSGSGRPKLPVMLEGSARLATFPSGIAPPTPPRPRRSPAPVTATAGVPAEVDERHGTSGVMSASTSFAKRRSPYVGSNAQQVSTFGAGDTGPVALPGALDGVTPPAAASPGGVSLMGASRSETEAPPPPLRK